MIIKDLVGILLARVGCACSKHVPNSKEFQIQDTGNVTGNILFNLLFELVTLFKTFAIGNCITFAGVGIGVGRI